MNLSSLNTIQIPKNFRCIILKINLVTYIYLNNFNNTIFIKIPLKIEAAFETAKNKLLIDSELTKNLSIIHTINKIIKKFTKRSVRGFKKKIFLKGIGYKLAISKNKKFILFKVGYSSVKAIVIPKFIRGKVVGRKFNILILKSYNLILLNNFCFKIIKIKPPDSYKGKGIHLNYITKRYKEVKKKR